MHIQWCVCGYMCVFVCVSVCVRACVCACVCTSVSHSPFFRRVGADNPVIKHHTYSSSSSSALARFCFQPKVLSTPVPEEWPLPSVLLPPSSHLRLLLQLPPRPVALEVCGEEPAPVLSLLLLSPLLILLSKER